MNAKDQMETFLTLMNRFRSLNLFSLLPLARHDYIVLFAIRCLQQRHGHELTVSALVQEMHTAQSAVSRTLRSLEKQGLIRREVSRDDRRNTYVILMPEGREAIRQADHVLETFHSGILSHFSSEEMAQLLTLLERLYLISDEQLEQMKKGEINHG